jgi:hypothetical protein
MCRRPVIPWMKRDLLGAAFLSDKEGKHSMSASSLRLEHVCLLSAVFFGYWTCSRQIVNIYVNFTVRYPVVFRLIKSRRMRWAGHVARVGEKRGVYRVLVEKPEGKTPLGTHP